MVTVPLRRTEDAALAHPHRLRALTPMPASTGRDYGSELSTVDISSSSRNAAILTFVSPPPPSPACIAERMARCGGGAKGSIDPAPPDGWQLCRSDERERPATRGVARGRWRLGIREQLRLVGRARGRLVDAEDFEPEPVGEVGLGPCCARRSLRDYDEWHRLEREFAERRALWRVDDVDAPVVQVARRLMRSARPLSSIGVYPV